LLAAMFIRILLDSERTDGARRSNPCQIDH
jgi:hypothetical protein